MKKITTLIFFTMLGSFFYGQTDSKKDSVKTNKLEELVIVASRKPTKISDIPGTVWVIPEQKLKTLVSTGIPIKEMLGQLIPSMDTGAQGRTNFGQNMRGRAMLVMINGVSLNSLRGVSRQLDAIDPFNIKQIEVLSGASSIYGGNASGGIINIITKSPKKESLSGETQLGFRSGFIDKEDIDYRIAQSLAVKKDKLSTRLGIAYQQNGGVYGADKKQVFTDITQTDLQYNKSIDVLATIGYKFNSKHKISVTAQYYDSKFNGDKVLSLGKNFGAILTMNPKLLVMKDGFTSDKRIGTHRYLGILSYMGKNILGGQDLHIQLSSRGEELGFYPFPSILKYGKRQLPYTSSSEQNTYYKGIKAILHKNWQNLKLTYGIDADFEDFNALRNIYNVKKAFASGGLVNETFKTTDRYPNIFSKSYAGYVQAKYKILPTLTLNGGLRYQNNNVKVDDFTGTIEQVFLAFGLGKSADVIKGGSSSYDVTLGNVGLLFKPNENNQLWATFSQGAQLADPAKFYGVGNYDLNLTNGNWDLKNSVNINDTKLQGIVTNQYEVGFRTNYKGLRAQLAGFYSISDKNIAIQTNPKGRLYISVEDLNLRNVGIEAEISYNMNNGFYLGANALLIKSEVKKDNKWLKQSIFTASPSKLVSYLGYQKGNFTARFQNQQTFNLKDNGNNQIKGFNLSDITFGYKTSFGKFTLGIQNVFNTDYKTIWSSRAEKLYGKFLPLPGLFSYKGRGKTFNLTYNIAI